MATRYEPVSSFVDAWKNWHDDDNTVDDDYELVVNAQPFIDYNISEGGYLSENDDEYLDGFAVYADANYIVVHEIEEQAELGRVVVFGEAYTFAIPIDAYVEFEFMRL